MFLEKLATIISARKSLVCVGLDFDPEKTEPRFRDDPFAFNKLIIDATADLVCAYKPNAAFYEALGMKGLEALQKTIAYVPKGIPVILDAKRGDIGNTSRMYAKAAFEWLGADAITVAPYMGEDSVMPFLSYPDKGIFVLCLTSNPGSDDFQKQPCGTRPFYYTVAEKCNAWAKKGNPNIGLVVGATQATLAELRGITALPFLVPGVGAQGGDLEAAVRRGNSNGIAIINSSRNIIFPAGEGDLKTRIRQAAESLRNEINRFL